MQKLAPEMTNGALAIQAMSLLLAKDTSEQYSGTTECNKQRDIMLPHISFRKTTNTLPKELIHIFDK